jgi:hypothetical protein
MFSKLMLEGVTTRIALSNTSSLVLAEKDALVEKLLKENQDPKKDLE